MNEPPQSGEYVSIVGALHAPDGDCARYKVYRDTDEAIALGERLGGQWITRMYFVTAQEGVNWCRDPDGPEVEALRAAWALR